jgi:ornithine racemase
MRYPVLEIDLEKLRCNTKIELDYFHAHGIEIMGVNKVFNGMTETAEAIVQSGMKVVAESNLGNLVKLKNLPCKKALLRRYHSV